MTLLWIVIVIVGVLVLLSLGWLLKCSIDDCMALNDRIDQFTELKDLDHRDHMNTNL